MLTLRPYQRESIDALNLHLQTKTNNPCVVLPTGAGKSLVMASAIAEWRKEYPPFRCIVLAHRKELVEQNSAEYMGLFSDAADGSVGIYAAGLGMKDMDAAITFAGIDSVYRKAGHFKPFDAIIVDEAHRIPVKGEGKYREFIAMAKELNPDIRVVGFTATPYRLGSGPICHKDYILNEICYEANIAHLIADGYLSPLRSKCGEAEPNLTDVKKSGGDYQQKDLGRIMADNDLVCRAVADALTHLNAEGRKCVVWFCTDIKHIDEVSRRLWEHGEKNAVVTGKTDAKVRDKLVEEFRAGYYRHILNVNVFTEGFNVKQVDAVVLLRPTLSKGLYCLDTQTEVLTRDGWKTDVNIGEDVLAFEKETGRTVFTPVLAKVRRQLTSNEHFMSICGQSCDIRVTNKHRMLYANKSKFGWKFFREAQDLAKLKNGAAIPVCGRGDFPGIPLTDDEIRFIGWVMTDGCINKKTNAICITQGSHQTEFCEEIEQSITRCGFKFGKYVRERTVEETHFKENGKLCVWTISKGLPRGRDKHLTGWARLEPWLSKDLSPALFDMDERQFDLLLKTIWKGDGNKHWESSYHIGKGNKTFIERLQIMAIQRGWRASVSCEKANAVRKCDLWLLHAKKTGHIHVGSSFNGKSSHAQWKEEPFKEEECWCVETSYGTIVTRRNGRVCIVGNCQMVGRCLRLHPDKKDCIVLDYARCIETHGPIDDLGDEKVRTAVCGECREVFARPLGKCPHCGWVIPKQEVERMEREERQRAEHEARAARLAILGSLPQKLDVDDVSVTIHRKDNSPESLCVTYRSGMRTVREWLCFGHGGYAERKARNWWRDRFDGDEAERVTVESIASDLFSAQRIKAVTKSVTALKKGKYYEVVGWEIQRGNSIYQLGTKGEIVE